MINRAAAATTTTQNQTVGIVIPLYVYPGTTWTAVAQAKQSNPNVPFIAVINPNSGPGSSLDPNYLQGIQQLQAAGVTVLGYVDTAYAADNASSVEANVNDYNSWYHVNGIMFDDMSNAAAEESYYSALNSYVKSLGMTFTMGNPGTLVPTSEIGVFNLLDIYENNGLPALSSFPTGYPTTDFSLIGISVSSLNSTFLSSASSSVGFVYLTDAGLPNPYDVLPSYFGNEVSSLATIDASSPLSTTGTASITIRSLAMNGTEFDGMWTTVASGGNTVATGFTPLTYTGDIGTQYTVTVSNYQSYNFVQWQGDGSTNPARSVTLSQSMQLSAYYTTTSSTSSSTATSSTASTTSSSPTQSLSTVTTTTTVTAPAPPQATVTYTVTKQSTYTGPASTVTTTTTKTIVATTTVTDAPPSMIVTTTVSAQQTNSSFRSITTTVLSPPTSSLFQNQSQSTSKSAQSHGSTNDSQSGVQTSTVSSGNLLLSPLFSENFQASYSATAILLGALVPVPAGLVYRQELLRYLKHFPALLRRTANLVKGLLSAIRK